MNNFIIYAHTSPSGKKYIGQTNNYNRRCRAHKQLNSGCRAFSDALIKYGWDNFTHEILEENLTIEDANTLEVFYINKYDSIVPNGYNLESGGKNGLPSKETREIWSKQRIGRYVSDLTKDKLRVKLKGRIFTEEHRESISKALKNSIKFKISIKNVTENNKGKTVSLETRNKISMSLTGKKQSEVTIHRKKLAITGLKRSVKAKENMSAARKGVPSNMSDENRIALSNKMKKRYIVISPDYIKYHIVGLQEFCIKNGLNLSSMVQVAKNKLNSHRGYTCEYDNQPYSTGAISNTGQPI